MAKEALNEKDNRLIKEALATLKASYERQINSKNNDLIKETYRSMLREVEAVMGKV